MNVASQKKLATRKTEVIKHASVEKKVINIDKNIFWIISIRPSNQGTC